jgi:transposase
MWYVGVDWADTHHDVAVLAEAGKRVGARRFSHRHQGLNELKQFVLNMAPEVEHLACLGETNQGWLIPFLLEAGIPVSPVNPKTAKQLRNSAGAKTDPIDAHLPAQIGRLALAELRRLEPESRIVPALKTLTRDQDALIQTQTRLVKRLTACLKASSPAAWHLFAKVPQRSTLVFVQASPTPQAAQAAAVAALTATLRSGKPTNPSRAAPKIFEELQRPQLVATEVIVRAKSRLMWSPVKPLLVVMEEMAGYDEAISALFLTHPDHELWSSLPRAGKRLAPRLLAEWGDDRRRYADATGVQTLAGTAPVPLQRGNDAKAHQRFACLKPLRHPLHRFARHSTRQEAWAPASSQRKRAEGKTQRLAVRALAKVWVRIISRLWGNKTG